MTHWKESSHIKAYAYKNTELYLQISIYDFWKYKVNKFFKNIIEHHVVSFDSFGKINISKIQTWMYIF